jgi:hypothetical protein
MQYIIFLLLERHGKVTIETMAELLEGADATYVANECNGLLYHPSFNIKKSSKMGLISSPTVAEGKDLTVKDEITINLDFVAQSTKISTIPVNVVVK